MGRSEEVKIITSDINNQLEIMKSIVIFNVICKLCIYYCNFHLCGCTGTLEYISYVGGRVFSMVFNLFTPQRIIYTINHRYALLYTLTSRHRCLIQIQYSGIWHEIRWLNPPNIREAQVALLSSSQSDSSDRSFG